MISMLYHMDYRIIPKLPSNPCDYYTNGKVAKVSHTQNDTVVADVIHSLQLNCTQGLRVVHGLIKARPIE